MLAYGYKPSDLMQMTALDVVDFFRGHRARLEMEIKLLFDAAEMAGMLATGKFKRSRPVTNEQRHYSERTRQLIDEEDRKDKEKGKIK